MKRYFFFAASYRTELAAGSCNFGTVLSEGVFPSIDFLKKIVKERETRAFDIVILSICELAAEDYKFLFKL